MGSLRHLAQVLQESLGSLGDPWLGRPLGLCLSGGADSSALVLAAGEVRHLLPAGTVVLHALHGLRGSQSEADRLASRELAGRCGLAFREVEALVAPGPNLEDRARKARYQALRAAFDGLLVTAHHRDDRVETLVLRLLRGAGPAGLRGIHRLRSDGTWRPFLDQPGQLLRDACGEAGWVWREDASNRDERFLRNWVRNAWLPSQDAATASSLAHLADACEALSPLLERRMAHLARTASLQADTTGFRLDLSAWSGLPLPHPELDLLLERAWTSTGRRPWATQQRERLIQDVLSGQRGRRRGGQHEIALWGARVLQVRRWPHGDSDPQVGGNEVETPQDG
jgi:tRNA(Ile)-lysidine synthase